MPGAVFIISLLFTVSCQLPAVSSVPGEKPRLPFGGTDFVQYYATSRLILAGENPYDHDKVWAIQKFLGADGVQVPYGPPPCLLPFIPLGWLDFATAVQIQSILNATFLVLSGFLWGLILFPDKPHMPLIAAVCAIGWIPSWSLMGLGHVTTWPLFGFTGWCFFLQHKRPLPAGIALALTIVKPHLALGPILYAGVLGIRHREWKMLIAFVSSVTLAFLATLLIRPTIWNEYLHSLAKSNPMQWYNATLDGWGRKQLDFWGMEREAAILGIDPSKIAIREPPLEIKQHYGNRFRFVSVTVGILLFGWIAFLGWRGQPKPEQAALVSMIALCGIPYAFSYDYVLLLPGFILTIGRWLFCKERMAFLVLVGWLLLDAFYFTGKARSVHESNFFIMPWAAFALMLLMLSFGKDISISRDAETNS